MYENSFSRRQLLRAAAALGAAGAVGFESTAQAATKPMRNKTPPMTPQDMAAIDVAMGKKGNYVEEFPTPVGVNRNLLSR